MYYLIDIREHVWGCCHSFGTITSDAARRCIRDEQPRQTTTIIILSR